MKNLFTYSIIILTGFIALSCDKPAPTELIDDSSSGEITEYEVLTKDLNNQYYNSGVDTSGVTQDIRGLTNLISVSGIKITHNNRTDEFSLAQAIFFDRSQPVYYENGNLLAYKTITPGIVKFDGHIARIDSFRLRYRDGGTQRQVFLGNKYILFNRRGGIFDPFIFPYLSLVNFELVVFNESVSFDIPTPPEINGNVILIGKKRDKNLEAVLEWNARQHPRISIVVGLRRQGQHYSIPVFRIKTRDDGRLRIPKRFFEELPLEDFDKIVLTFVRGYENSETFGSNKLFVSSQSIHSIVINIP